MGRILVVLHKRPCRVSPTSRYFSTARSVFRSSHPGQLTQFPDAARVCSAPWQQHRECDTCDTNGRRSSKLPTSTPHSENSVIDHVGAENVRQKKEVKQSSHSHPPSLGRPRHPTGNSRTPKRTGEERGCTTRRRLCSSSGAAPVSAAVQQSRSATRGRCSVRKILC